MDDSDEMLMVLIEVQVDSLLVKLKPFSMKTSMREGAALRGRQRDRIEDFS